MNCGSPWYVLIDSSWIHPVQCNNYRYEEKLPADPLIWLVPSNGCHEMQLGRYDELGYYELRFPESSGIVKNGAKLFIHLMSGGFISSVYRTNSKGEISFGVSHFTE